jgi:hypothetical protein
MIFIMNFCSIFYDETALFVRVTKQWRLFYDRWWTFLRSGASGGIQPCASCCLRLYAAPVSGWVKMLIPDKTR